MRSSKKIRFTNYFTTINLQSAYNQIEIPAEDRYFYTFKTYLGTYKMARLAYGLKTAPFVFASLLSQAFPNTVNNNRVTYMDDILLSSDTEEDMLFQLELVFQKLKQHNLVISPKKIDLCKKSVKFLSFIISKDGYKPSPDRIQAVLDLKVPTTVKGVQRFCGSFNYVAKFIPKLSLLLAPFYDLLKKDKPFKVTDTHHKNLETLKQSLANCTLLHIPTPQGKLVLTVDASSFGCGAILTEQVDPNSPEERPIGYFSKKFNKAQSSYPSFKLEILGIAYALQNFEKLLKFKKFLLRTDARSVLYLFKNNNIPAFLQRKLMYFSSFNFDMQHLSNRSKPILFVDFLSRQESQKPTLTTPSFETFCASLSIQNNQLFPDITRIYRTKVEDDDLSDLELTLLTQPAHLPTSSPSLITTDVMPRDVIQKAQRQDVHLATIIDSLLFGNYVKNYLLDSDDVLFKIVDHSKLLCIPTSILPTFMEKFHQASGHFGQDKTWDLLRSMIDA